MSTFDKIQQVIEKAQSDYDFRDRLIENTKATLEEEGFVFPPEVTDVQVVLDTRSTMHFVLPLDREGEGDNWVC